MSEEEINRLLARLGDFERGDIGFRTYVKLTEGWLKNYPTDIFTGVSGDSGPTFVVDIRKAIDTLREATK